MRQNNYNFFG